MTRLWTKFSASLPWSVNFPAYGKVLRDSVYECYALALAGIGLLYLALICLGASILGLIAAPVALFFPLTRRIYLNTISGVLCKGDVPIPGTYPLQSTEVEVSTSAKNGKTHLKVSFTMSDNDLHEDTR